MAYDNFNSDNATKQKTYVTLNDGSLRLVPEGADPDTVRRIENRKLDSREATTPAKRTATTRTGSRKPSRRTNYAAQVLAREVATLEMVKTENAPKPDPTMDENVITIHRGDFTAYMSRTTWEISYV